MSLVQERLGLTDKVELRQNWTEDELQQIFRATYEQVFGRVGVSIGDTFASAESLLRNGSINIKQFVATLAKSELYKERFFYSNSQVRFIELNYKHLLGRAPYDQSEIAAHVDTYASQGYDAEIDSYIYSPEYDAAFGDNTVPYCRGFQSIPGMKTVGFNRFFALYHGNGNSDNAQLNSSKSILGRRIAGDLTNTVVFASVSKQDTLLETGSLKAAFSQEDSRIFLVEASSGLGSSKVAVRQGRSVKKVPFNQLSDYYQQVHKQGRKILSITPL
jgi:phycoerythrocyanin-associated rod linker protein